MAKKTKRKPPPEVAPLGADLFKFLKALKKNNDRAWFEKNKGRYEAQVKFPLLQFIADMQPGLRKISPHLVADPRPVGGSLFRIYRDVRFSKDKSPYKTFAAVHFRHEAAKDVHAPGLYVHLDPGEVFLGAGIWRPEKDALAAIREALIDRSAEWKKLCNAKAFRDHLDLSGDSLKRPPKGFDPEHPLIEDLKRKDFCVVSSLNEQDVANGDLPTKFLEFCRRSKPFMKFLTSAVGRPF